MDDEVSYIFFRNQTTHVVIVIACYAFAMSVTWLGLACHLSEKKRKIICLKKGKDNVDSFLCLFLETFFMHFSKDEMLLALS